ncbi:BTAD domain-containing putative transcriptional regulator [Saccharomonospora xinjiangensis]|uniref:AfsR/SARP family transcriptional regulator n=1 Tax=Saccharomonospora xinjiangensis TaxID=75294 RepID=UPI00106FBCE3|nr:BTAD domain-containing putative transcriptional regulator [Saccharomonospora xinjiangensis]QBQ58415.1 Putative HTH-type transcriptional regulator [Saccharomonospora xinjiangensis]
MRFGVLGPLAVWTEDGTPVRIPELKVRALLARLVVAEGRIVSSDRLVEQLWGHGRLPRNPIGALHTRVSQLRKVLDSVRPGGRELVVSERPGYRLRWSTAMGVEGSSSIEDTVDAIEFRALTASADATADARERVTTLSRALGLWRGPAYADFADCAFAKPAAARLEEERLAAVEKLAEARLELGEHSGLVGELSELVNRHPLRERLRESHIRALYLAGRQGEALAGYADLRRRLADELGVDPSPSLVALHGAILAQAPELGAASETGYERDRLRLPSAATRLVGRAEAVARVRSLVSAHRLVTLTGPGGVGKTQLAIEVARGLDGTFADGVALVELSGIDTASTAGTSSPQRIVDVLASALDIRDEDMRRFRGDDVTRLAAALRSRRMLLLLDNCEHVIEPIALVVRRLLDDCPDLSILATSREPLSIAGEWLWPVPTLDVPAQDADLATILASGSVTLFADRAAAAVPGFRVDAPNAAAVAAICRRLDGIPLAIELAASRLRVLDVHDLAARLDDRFGLLVSSRRDAPARHRTLRAMIDWSWELLGEPERALLRRLGVHTDGFTLAAAEAVASRETGVSEGAGEPTTLDLLSRLVDRSLVVVSGSDGGTGNPGGHRYALLESVREYCVEQSRITDEYDELRTRHLHHYVGLVERARPLLYGAEQLRGLGRLDRNLSNIRTALDTAVRVADVEQATRLVDALTWYCVLRGCLNEAGRALDAVLALNPDPRLVAWRAGIAFLMGDGTTALARRARSAHDEITTTAERARARWFLAHAQRGGGLTTAADLAERTLDEFGEVGDHWGIAAALNLRAEIERERADLEAAHRDATSAWHLFREVGDRWGQMQATSTLAELAETEGDFERAAGLHSEGLRMAGELSRQRPNGVVAFGPRAHGHPEPAPWLTLPAQFVLDGLIGEG